MVAPILQSVYAHLPVNTIKKIPGAAYVNGMLWKLFKKRGESVVDVQGFKMKLNLEDSGVSRPILMSGIFEPEVTQAFRKHLKEGMTFADIGANVGYFSRLASTLVGPRGQVIAFEPSPANFERLCENIELNRLTQCVGVQSAVGASAGQLELFLDGENFGNHSLSNKNIPASASDSVFVEVVKLDDWWSQFIKKMEATETAKIDAIKLDIQGAEAMAIQGARAVLERHAPILFLEFWPEGLRNLGSAPLELLTLLKSYGYNLQVAESGDQAAHFAPEEIVLHCTKKKWGESFVNLICTQAGR